MEEIEKLEEQLKSLAETMKPMHFEIAKGLLEGKTQDQAYVDAGGKGNDKRSCASKLISTNPIILKYIEVSKRVTSLRSQQKEYATFEQKKQMLWDAALRCMEDVSEKYVGRGDSAEFVGYVFDVKGMAACVAELNKMDGHLATIKTSNSHTHKFDDLTEDELDDRIADLQRKTGATKASS